MKRLIYSERSLADLADILDYIARDNPAAAVNFGAGVISTCELIAKNPNIGQRREDVVAFPRSMYQP